MDVMFSLIHIDAEEIGLLDTEGFGHDGCEKKEKAVETK
jgi:hypothetical protein